MYKAAAVAVTVVMIACFTPLTSFAHGGLGQGAAGGTGIQDGTGPDRDRDRDRTRDGSCALVNASGKNLVAAGRGGRMNGPRDGSGPRRDGSNGTCPYPVS